LLLPSTYGYDTRVRVGVECLRACDGAAAAMHRLTLPLLVFHSSKDTLTDPDGSKALHAAAKVTGGGGGQQ
jgi:alpha-beta hydrolase superfamily lysophospholipase